MPAAQVFRHQSYLATEPQTPHQYLSVASSPPVDSRAWRLSMRELGESLRAHRVARVYLVHGTFAGLDAGGLYGEISRLIPGARRALGNLQKHLVDAITGDNGNFTDAYARRLAAALLGIDPANSLLSNADELIAEPQPLGAAQVSSTTRIVPETSAAITKPAAASEPAPIEVRLFNWSSENHHLGRAEAAVELLYELLQAPPQADERILLIGHSHAGNVFALLTNLLAADRETRDAFFEAASIHYRIPGLDVIDMPLWFKVASQLHEPQRMLDTGRLDFVTLGTPIRYGWHPDGHGRLLHIVSHRPSRDLPPYRAKFPPSIDEVLRGVGGDFIQQLGIAGTNTIPSIFAPRSWWADRRLHRILQRDVPGDVFTRLAIGQRVPDTGETLLVDYGELDHNILHHLAGHGLYTQESLMHFHLSQIATRLYPPSDHKVVGTLRVP